MFVDSYNCITLYSLFYQYFIYKCFLRFNKIYISNKLYVSFNIINVFYNAALSINGFYGILNPDSDEYANNIIFIHKSAQVVNLINEVPHYLINYFTENERNSSAPLIGHHILLLILMHNIELNIANNSCFYVCLYAGASEISSIIYGIITIFSKVPFLSNNFYYLESCLKLSFGLIFIIIRCFMWTYYTPSLLHDNYRTYGLNITHIAIPIFQLMQYYWLYLIILKIKKQFGNNNIKLKTKII